jgi:hypothetical protein
MPTDISKAKKQEADAKRLVAYALTQRIHYMKQAGIEYG